jgi:glyoxylase-like metal-dependent hydrolase (beta-lactamase superfamily II)
MILEVIPVGPLQCNCVILGDEGTGEALVIDPGDEPDRVVEALKRLSLRPRLLLHTHAHIDHVAGTAGVQEALGVEAALHPGDGFLYDILDIQAQMVGMAAPRKVDSTSHLKDGQAVAWGACEGEVLHTPGHTPGSVCLYVPETDLEIGSAGGEAGAVMGAEAGEEPGAKGEPRRPLLLSGDTLFSGSIGRTDLWGGSFEEIMASIRDRLLVLPDTTLIVPGHGPASTIALEKVRNPFLRDLRSG